MYALVPSNPLLWPMLLNNFEILLLESYAQLIKCIQLLVWGPRCSVWAEEVKRSSIKKNIRHSFNFDWVNQLHLMSLYHHTFPTFFSQLKRVMYILTLKVQCNIRYSWEMTLNDGRDEAYTLARLQFQRVTLLFSDSFNGKLPRQLTS